MTVELCKKALPNRKNLPSARLRTGALERLHEIGLAWFIASRLGRRAARGLDASAQKVI
jgi:hypothetical protein